MSVLMKIIIIVHNYATILKVHIHAPVRMDIIFKIITSA